MFYADIKQAINDLEKNEQRLFLVCDRIGAVPNETFLGWFPFPFGIQITCEEWGLRLVGPPALPRANNNNWSILRQMELWQRWFRLAGGIKLSEPGVRYLAEIRHFTKDTLPFIPNPIEAHSMLDGLTSILAVDDNLELLDLNVSVEPGPEACEIRLIQNPENVEASSFKSTSIATFEPVRNMENAAFEERISDMMQRLRSLNDKDVMSLYRLLLERDFEIRKRLPYRIISQYYPLRRIRGASTAKYRDSLKKDPLQIAINGDTVLISSNVPCRSREQFAADAFVRELSRCLRQNPGAVERLRARKNKLEILQKRTKPDADNLPFDAIFEKFSNAYLIPLEPNISVSYGPQMEPYFCISITPSEHPQMAP